MTTSSSRDTLAGDLPESLHATAAALPAEQTLPRVAHPVFGNETPRMPAIPANLPPNMQSALRALQKALTEPPSLAGQWPFADPPAVATARAAGGRPPAVKPHQVVMLARFLRLGWSLNKAAARAKLKKSTAIRLSQGVGNICRHEAVVAAGVVFPMPRGEHPPKEASEGPAGTYPLPTPFQALLGGVHKGSTGHPRSEGTTPNPPADPSDPQTAPISGPAEAGS